MSRKEKLELTDEQCKAFASFKRAYKKCKKSGIVFYTCMRTITALNGENIIRIHDEDDKGDICTNDLDNPYIDDVGFSGWADDEHFVELS